MKDIIPHILPHLWQSTIFGLIIVAVLLALPKASARVRYLAGWFGLAKFLLPLGVISTAAPALNIISEADLLGRIGLQPVLLPEFVVYAHRPAVQAAAAAAATKEVDWMALALWSWPVVAALLMLVVTARTFFVSRRVLQAAVPFDGDAAERLAKLAVRLGVNPQRVRGYLTGSPTLLGVVGLFRSRILVPRDLVQTLDRDEVEAVLLHELAHVRRRDNLWRLLQAGVVGLFWFHPLVWWLHGRLRWESERACDELVLSAQRNQQAYAGVLLKAARFALGLGMPAVSGMSRMRLQPRVRAILNHQTRKDSAMKTTGLLLLLGGTLAVCSVYAQVPPLEVEPKLSSKEQALFKRVLASMEQGNKLEALGILQDYLTYEDAHSPATLFNVGNLHLDMGDLEQGKVHYEAALAEFPEFKRARRLLFIVTAQRSEFEETVKHGEQYLAQFGDDGDDLTHGILGLAYYNIGEPERAVEYYEVAVERDPEQADWKAGLAQVYMETEQYEKCIGVLEQLLDKDPNGEDLLLFAANAALGLDDHDRARAFLARAQAISGSSMDSPTPIDNEQFDVAPVPHWLPYASYPQKLKRDGVEGRVVVAFTVTVEGRVDEIEIVSATHEEFAAAVLERLKDWIYEPGTKNGEPVSVRMRVPYDFTLN